MTASGSYIGAAVPRIEGPDKVTGRATYAADISLPGMLWGKILRSPHPHARIVQIDASRARQAPGVRAVVTGADIPGHYMGKVLRDIPVLCWDRVRHVGDRVAAVAADTPEQAEAALALIEVEYAPLPAVFDPLQAMQPGAPLLHDDVTAYDGFPVARSAADLHNGQTRLAWSKGDVEQGFRESDVVLEHTFRIPSRHQGYIEPYASVVHIDNDGRVQVWTSSKSPFRVRLQTSKATGVPEERIRVNVVNIGGDFGGKGDARDVPVAYFLARESGRPVKMVLGFGEELTASNPTHPTVITIRSGISREGLILARQVRTVHASGAYGGLKPNAALSTWHYVGGCYRVVNATFEFLQIYTNHVPGGYFRAPGAHQFTFALECHTDLLAQEIGMEPSVFRMKNLLQDGEVDAVGNTLRRIRAREALQAAMDASGWHLPRRGLRRGRGMALFGRQIGGGAGGAILTADRDGTLILTSPTFDQGVGTHTVMRQLIAEEMGVPLERVQVEIGDTDTAPFDEGPRASRVTYTEGQAVLKACAQLTNRLARDAAALLECPPERVIYFQGMFVGVGRRVGLAEVVARAGGPVTERVQIDAPHHEDILYFCAQVAEVEVDPETGQVQLQRLVTAHDVGTIINPITHQGQIDGGVVTGIGLALTEELVMEDGRIVTSHLGEYKLPTVADLPPVETVLVPSGGSAGPYQASAIGELSNNPTPAAVANAVADAVGARLFELPVTSERVYRVLKERRLPLPRERGS